MSRYKMISQNKELRQLAARAEARGWRIVITSRHTRWYPPDGGPFITCATTPSPGPRTFLNHLARLRRADPGLDR